MPNHYIVYGFVYLFRPLPTLPCHPHPLPTLAPSILASSSPSPPVAVRAIREGHPESPPSHTQRGPLLETVPRRLGSC